MSLLAYQKLKPSVVEYLDEIPNDWPLKRLGDLVGFAQGKAHEPYIDDDGDYICVNSRFVSTSGKTIKTCSLNLTPASLNDILMVMSDLPNGRALARAYYVADHGKYAVNQRVCRITAEKAHPRFLFYVLDRHPGLMQNDDGVHQTHLSNADFQKLKIYLPSISEQTQIAGFLDHEAGRIDALIEEQQRLIELLKEKRQAVISHAVTKGLDPTVPMKDSGVEWLGEVPAHWEITALKYVVSSLGQGWSPQCDNYPAEDGEWGVLKVGCVNGGVFNPAENKRLPDELEPDAGLTVKQGDLLISRANSRELVGSAAVAVKDYPWLMLCDKLYRLRLSAERALPEFLAHYLGSSAPRGQIELAASGASDSMQNISQSVVMDMSLTLPPLSEQRVILQFLGDTLKISDELVAEVTNQRCLLQERRSALISAAVTGKIDVRGWQPPARAQSPKLVQEAV